MDRAGIRLRLLEQVDWQPDQSTSFVAKVNRLVNRAQQLVFDDAPFLFEGEAKIVTQIDATNAAVAGDRLNVNATDRWVMERSSATVGRTAWQFDGTWDGRWVDITDPNSQVHRVQSREWWSDDQGVERFSMVEPWPNASDTGMAYRIYTPEYYLPGDVVEVRQAKLYHSSRRTLTVASRQDIERYRLFDFQGQQVGFPSIVYHGDHFQLMAPTRAPTVATASLWAGPDTAGEFDYCYTYVWGNVDPAELTPLNLSEVRWESAPSPVSGRSTAVGGGVLNRLTLPNVDFELDFGRGGSVRINRSGLRKRIYARRYSNVVGGGIGAVAESPEVFMLLDEVAGNTTTYDHDGARFLDYQRRLKPIHGYRGVRFYPLPNERFEIDCRVLFRPADLDNDADVPRLHEDVMDTLIQKALVLFYEMDGKPELAQVAEVKYRTALVALTKRYAVPPSYFASKKAARVRPGIGGVQRSKVASYREPT